MSHPRTTRTTPSLEQLPLDVKKKRTDEKICNIIKSLGFWIFKTCLCAKLESCPHCGKDMDTIYAAGVPSQGTYTLGNRERALYVAVTT